MKKFLLLLLLFLLFLSCSVSATEVIVNRVPFDVVINEQKINIDDEYPLLFYKDIVYLPTTFNMNNFVGLRVEFFPNYKIADKKVGSIFVGLDKITTKNYVSYPVKEINTEAIVQENVIVVNHWDKINDIKNSEREYPVINYKNVIYIPLSYDIVVKKLDWKLNFSWKTGLEVDTRTPNVPILDAIHSSIVGYNSNPKFSPPAYIYNENAYAGYPITSFEGNVFIYKEVGGEEVRNRIPIPTDGDYYYNRITTTGNDIKYDKNNNATLDSQGILKIPAVKKATIDGKYIGKNVYFTIDVKNGYLLKTEE